MIVTVTTRRFIFRWAIPLLLLVAAVGVDMIGRKN